MSSITIPIPDDDLKFLEAWTRDQGTTVEEFFTREAVNLRKHLQAPLHPAVLRATGVIRGDIDARKEYLEYLERKHA
ncbi:MAG: hypothetical protein JWR15_1453 [Prosthecobacter sp.]|nr:hypothetical protein [Prosthecobacter sp.]